MARIEDAFGSLGGGDSVDMWAALNAYEPLTTNLNLNNEYHMTSIFLQTKDKDVMDAARLATAFTAALSRCRAKREQLERLEKLRADMNKALAAHDEAHNGFVAAISCDIFSSLVDKVDNKVDNKVVDKVVDKVDKNKDEVVDRVDDPGVDEPGVDEPGVDDPGHHADETKEKEKKKKKSEKDIRSEDTDTLRDLTAAYQAVQQRIVASWQKQASQVMMQLALELESDEADAAGLRQVIVLGAKEAVRQARQNENEKDAHQADGSADIPPKTCPICLDREADTCCVPCGHTLCQECSKKVRAQKCGMCRAVVTSYVQLKYSL